MKAHMLITITGLIVILSGCLHQPSYSERRASYIKDFESNNHTVCSFVQINYDECMAKQRQRFGEIFDDEQREIAVNTRTNTYNYSNNVKSDPGHVGSTLNYNQHGQYLGTTDNQGNIYSKGGQYMGTTDSTGMIYDQHGQYKGTTDKRNGMTYDQHGQFKGYSY